MGPNISTALRENENFLIYISVDDFAHEKERPRAGTL